MSVCLSVSQFMSKFQTSEITFNIFTFYIFLHIQKVQSFRNSQKHENNFKYENNHDDSKYEIIKFEIIL